MDMQYNSNEEWLGKLTIWILEPQAHEFLEMTQKFLTWIEELIELTWVNNEIDWHGNVRR